MYGFTIAYKFWSCFNNKLAREFYELGWKAFYQALDLI